MKKFVLKTLALATGLVSVNSYAAFGFADLNIADIPNMLQSSFSASLQQGMQFSIKAMPGQMAENQARIQTAMEKLKIDIETRRKYIPSAQACAAMKSNASILNASSSSTEALSRSMAEKTKAEQVGKGEAKDRIDSIRQSTVKYNCTDADVAKGINGCQSVTNRATAGLDRNPQSLKGATIQVGDKVYNSGGVIPREEWGGVPAGAFYESAKNYLNKKYYTNEPAEIVNKEANSSDAGQTFNNSLNSFLNRKNQALEIEMRYLEKEVEVKSDNKALKAFWDNVSIAELKEIRGDSYEKTKMPSENILLEYAVNKGFTKLGSAINSLGDSGSETQLLVIQSKIMLEQLKAQRDTNAILSSILLQQLDPVSIDKLNNERKRAESGVVRN